MTTTVKRIRVELSREDLTKLFTDVFEHEIPILLLAFGQGNVRPIDDAKLKPEELEEGIDGEYARLLRKYRRANVALSPVAQAFPSAEALARALGVSYQPNTGLAPFLVESEQYDGSNPEQAEKPKRGRPPKAKQDADADE